MITPTTLLDMYRATRTLLGMLLQIRHRGSIGRLLRLASQIPSAGLALVHGDFAGDAVAGAAEAAGEDVAVFLDVAVGAGSGGTRAVVGVLLEGGEAEVIEMSGLVVNR